MSWSAITPFSPALKPPLHQSSTGPHKLGSQPLDDHLCNALPTQGLAPHKSLPLESSDKITGCCQQQYNRCRNQARGIDDDAKPLDQAHGTVNGCTHVVGSETSDEVVKGR